jgi:predicted DNA-binding transcriptional regulator AlpA
MMNPNEVYLPAKQVRARYGNVSDMALWRWLQDEQLNFPKPLMINGRRYWKLSDLGQWEAVQAARKVA